MGFAAILGVLLIPVLGVATFRYLVTIGAQHGVRHCEYWWEWPHDPNTTPQIFVVCALILTSIWWAHRRPTPHPGLRCIAYVLAFVTITATLGAQYAYREVSVEDGRIALWCSTFLVVCLLLEIRLHEPLLPRMRARRC